MDDLTFAFFIQVQLEGMRDLRQRSMDEKTQVTVLDSEVAHSDYERKLEKLQKIIYDRGLDQYNSSAVKINAAVTTNHQQVPEKLSTVEFDHQTDHNTTPATTIDTGVFTKLTEENNTIGDHPAASSLSDVNHSIKSAHTDADAAGELLQRLLNITNQVINSSRLKTESESSPRSNTGTEKLRCVSCLEDKHPADVTQAPCEHLYCRDCIVQLFEASKTDESLYPPCCCNKVILFSYVKDFMQDDFIRECVLKWIEWSTPQSTYCAEPTCSTFIPDWQTSRSIGVCSSCQKSTCTICKEENHAGECATSMTNQTLLALATEMGWTRCFFCSRMVELETGCNHVTCRCGKQFCYACGLEWKTCTCPLWDTNSPFFAGLRNEGRRRMARIAARPTLQPVENQQGCIHPNGNWRSAAGTLECARCGHDFPAFIFECRECQRWACEWCFQITRQ